MAKRFIDSEIFKKKFVRNLPAEHKLFWTYLFTECNHAGIWEVDFEVANLRLGTSLIEDEVVQNFKDKIQVLGSGEKWFVPAFIDFQYGELRENNRAHGNVISYLMKENLLDKNFKIIRSQSPFGVPGKGAKEKEMEMEKEKEKEQEKEKELAKNKKSSVVLPFNTEAFSNAWKAWTDYKEAQFKFRYKTDSTEQIALKELSEKAENNEQTAIKIIQQSIANGWKGFFELKPKPTQNNGKYTPEDYQKLGDTIDEWFERKYGV
jgi:hypothetical protein